MQRTYADTNKEWKPVRWISIAIPPVGVEGWLCSEPPLPLCGTYSGQTKRRTRETKRETIPDSGSGMVFVGSLDPSVENRAWDLEC